MTPASGDPAPLEAVAGSFRASEQIFARMGAWLFSNLSRSAADDPYILKLASHAMAGARPAHLLSSVHYLLLADPSAPLASWFATLVDNPLPPDTAYPEFVRFCGANHDEIVDLLRTRSVQTTYAERCRALLAPMCVVAREAGEPLNLIEIGCSAGVLLVFDKFAYRLDAQGLIGSSDAPLLLEGELRGPAPELFIPRIGQRIGIDLHTIDVRSQEERRWLLALCFPELRDEQRRLATALDVVAATDLRLLEGDGLARLDQAVAETSGPLCIYHSACLFYWPRDARAALEAKLMEISRTREFWRISIEPSDVFDSWQQGGLSQPAAAPADSKKTGEITIFRYRDGVERRIVGRPDADYGVIDWY